jgi:glycosyltransferase involved in cell wall biosynthesis
MRNDGGPTTVPEASHAGAVRLSVVLIARNQAEMIGRLIDSVLGETAAITGTADVLLVDSASEDATLDVAARYPIKILRLASGQRLTAAAGRSVGFEATAGESVLFLDGDMELLPGWLPRAMDVLASSPRIGAVTGYVLNVTSELAATEENPGAKAHGDGAVVELPCRRVGGMGLYRRTALERVGSFNPSLYSDEEPELCLRLRRAGFRFVRIESPAVRHYVGTERTFRSLLARRRRRLYLGHGQIIGSLLGSDLLWPYLRARGYGLAPAAVLLAGLGCVAWLAVAHAWVGVAAWAALVAAAVVFDALRKRSLYRACYSALHRLFIVEGMVRGLLLHATRRRNDYQPRFDEVK